MKNIKHMLLIGAGMALASSSAMAAFTFTNGDLILGFQASGGVGATQNVFYNLGDGPTLRDWNDGPTIAFGNLDSVLDTVYGSNWYSRSDVFFGVVGNLNSNANSGAGSRPAVDGDPSRTFYVSQQAATPGSGINYAPGSFTSSSLGIGGGAVTGLEGILASSNLTDGDGNTKIITQATAPVEWNNSWTAWNPIPGGAFNTFNGGIQQNFGKATSTTYADVQRILSTNTGALPTGVVGGGTYEFTLAIGQDGSVSAVSAIPEVSSSLLLGAVGFAAAFQRRRQKLA